ncbi:MAG: PAS domain S-box protein [Candidatus Rokuibacteriota bacterium]
MTPDSSPRWRSRLRLASSLSGAGTALVGAAVLAGWAFDRGGLDRVIPGLPAMRPGAAIALVIAGTSLSLQTRSRPRRWTRRLAQACALVVVLGAVVSLAVDAPGGGGLGTGTALGLLLLALAVLLLDVETRGGRHPAQPLGLAGGAVAAVALVGHLYGARALYGLAPHTETAAHTAATLLLLATGILLARPDRGFVATLTSGGPGGLMARRALPAALGVPLALGWLGLAGQRAGLYGAEVGVSLLVTVTTGVLAVLAWANAEALARADAARGESEASFRLLFAGNPLPMWVYDVTTLAFLEVNDAAVAHYGYSRAEFLHMRVSDIRPPADVPRFGDAVVGPAERPDEAVRPRGVPRRHRLKDGRVRDVDVVSHAMDFAGRRAAVVVAIDVTELKQAQDALAKYAERLNILHEVDRAIIVADPPVAIAEAVLRRLRDLLGVPRAIVNVFDFATGEAEWLAAAGRRRLHLGPGVRFPLALMGDVAALRRGQLQVVDVAALPPGPERDSLLASGVRVYMVVPMIAGGELIGGLSFGGAPGEFPPEQISIAQEAAAQLAIAIAQARLHERVKRQADELEQRVQERTRELRAADERLEREIGERRWAQEEADRAARAMGERLAALSHALRTPLDAVTGLAERLHDAKAGAVSPEQKEVLGDILGRCRRLLRLAGDVGDLANVESGTLDRRPAPVDLHRPADEARDAKPDGASP